MNRTGYKQISPHFKTCTVHPFHSFPTIPSSNRCLQHEKLGLKVSHFREKVVAQHKRKQKSQQNLQTHEVRMCLSSISPFSRTFRRSVFSRIFFARLGEVFFLTACEHGQTSEHITLHSTKLLHDTKILHARSLFISTKILRTSQISL